MIDHWQWNLWYDIIENKKFNVKRKILEAFPIVVNLAPSNVWLEGARVAPESPSIIQDGHGDMGDEEDVLEDRCPRCPEGAE